MLYESLRPRQACEDRKDKKTARLKMLCLRVRTEMRKGRTKRISIKFSSRLIIRLLKNASWVPKKQNTKKVLKPNSAECRMTISCWTLTSYNLIHVVARPCSSRSFMWDDMTSIKFFKALDKQISHYLLNKTVLLNRAILDVEKVGKTTTI